MDPAPSGRHFVSASGQTSSRLTVFECVPSLKPVFFAFRAVAVVGIPAGPLQCRLCCRQNLRRALNGIASTGCGIRPPKTSDHSKTKPQGPMIRHWYGRFQHRPLSFRLEGLGGSLFNHHPADLHSHSILGRGCLPLLAHSPPHLNAEVTAPLASRLGTHCHSTPYRHSSSQ